MECQYPESLLCPVKRKPFLWNTGVEKAIKYFFKRSPLRKHVNTFKQPSDINSKLGKEHLIAPFNSRSRRRNQQLI